MNYLFFPITIYGRAGPEWNILILLESCLQTPVTYHCWVYSE